MVERPESFDKRRAELEDTYRIPKFYLSDDDWQKVERYGQLEKRHKNFRDAESRLKIYERHVRSLLDLASDSQTADGDEAKKRTELGPDATKRLTELEAKIAEQRALLATKAYEKLSEDEQDERERLGEFVAYRAERYLHESRLELTQAPNADAFEGFESIAEETEAALEGKEAKKPNFSVLALQEVQILLKRIFGKNQALKALFEQFVVLKYDSERDQRRAEAAKSPRGEGQGGATITKAHSKGKEKFVVTVDDATFLERKMFRGTNGKEYSYPVANFVSAAFTIGRAIMRIAFNDQQIATLAKPGGDGRGERSPGAHGGHHEATEPFGRPPKPWPERLLYTGDQPNVLRPPGDEASHEVAEGLDFLTLYLLDPQQAQKISPEWYGRAERLFVERIGPEHMFELGAGQSIDQPQLRADHEYVYRNYDVNRTEPSQLARAGRWLAQTKPGLLARLGLGGAVGGLGGSTISGVMAGLGTAAGMVAGWKLFAPLKLFRTVQGVYRERLDFYFELAVSEHDKKEVSRIMAREENINDRDARLQLLLNTSNQEEMRRLLLADSETGDWALWRELLYLWKFDHKFRESKGREIEQESFNTITRLHRISNKAKRHGTKPSLYKTVRDEFGNTRYLLKTYAQWYEGIKYEVEARSERDMMGTIQEAFEIMDDQEGFIPLNAYIGENLDDPNSRGWKMGQVGDIRPLIGDDNGRQYLSFLNGSFGALDQRYLKKLDPYAELIIKRYRKFEKGKFPGEHAKLIAVKAFEYYSPELALEEAEPEPKQQEFLDKIETKSIDEMLRQDDFEAEDLARLVKQVEDDVEEREFGGSLGTGKKLPYPTIKAFLLDSLKALSGDLESKMLEHDREQPKGIDAGIGGELGNELKGLLSTYRGDLKGDYDVKIGVDVKEENWREEQDKRRDAFMQKLDGAQRRVSYLLEHPDLSVDERFRASEWLARLTKYAPQVEAVTEFRRQILGRIYRYEVAAGYDPVKDQFHTNKLDYAFRIARKVKADKNGNEDTKAEGGANLAQARTAIDEFITELETIKQEFIKRGQDIPDSLLENISQLQVVHATDNVSRFVELLDGAKKSFSAWFKKYSDDFTKTGLPERVKKETKQVTGLMNAILHARELERLGESLPGEAEAQRIKRHENFRSINAIPLSRREGIRMHNGIPDENDMLRYLKLAYAALQHQDRVVEAAKQAGSGKQTGGEVVVDLGT